MVANGETGGDPGGHHIRGGAVSVIVLGSINLDVLVRVDRLPAPGETRMARAMTMHPGGKGANQALAALRMGAPTILLGRVGEDAFAMQALKQLRNDGVDLSRVGISKTAPTGLAWIAVTPDGQNAITVAPGANGEVGEEALADLKDIVGAGDVVMMQAEVPVDTMVEAVRVAHRAGATVLWDPAPAEPDFPSALFGSDIVMPNQGEAEILLGVPITDVRSAKVAARLLRGRGAKVGVVKLGEAGVVWATSRGVFYQPGEAVETVDTVGAGDSFAGALAARLFSGDALGDAMRLANRAAALSTTRPGAQAAFPWVHDLQ